jgi:nitroreductase
MSSASSAAAKVLSDVVAQRRSIRAFHPTPLAPELIDHLLRLAQCAPSNCNVQPWIVHVVSGQTLSELVDAMLAEAIAGRRTEDIPGMKTYPAPWRDRQVACGKALYAAANIERHDEAARKEALFDNYRLFGAPHGLFIFLPRVFGLREAVDCGIYAQTFMLAAAAHGVGTCAQGSLSHHGQVLRDVLKIGDDAVCLFGISFGLPDESAATMQIDTGRAPLHSAVTFHP